MPPSFFRTATLLGSLLLAPAARAVWDLAPLATDESGALAVAVASDGRFAAADGRSVWLGNARGARRIDLSGAARDLAFAPDGALWIASETGLQRFADGRLELRAPAPGELARDARRVAADAVGIAVVTAGGVYFAADGERFARVEVPVGEAGASAVALERGADGPIVWIASERGLFRADPDDGAGARAERVALPIDLRPALDVVAQDGRVLALAPAWLAERDADGRWTTARPALPPGSTPIRVARSAHDVWIATDRGVVSAPAATGHFERAGDPAGSATANDLAIAGDRVLVATSRGVLVGGAEPAASAAAAGAIGAACEPPIRAVQRAALDHLRLAGDPAAAMRRGVRMRGFLPIVSVEASKHRDYDDRDAYDEAFVSGGYRHLYDRDRFRAHEREVALRLTWDLGDVAYHPEQIDVSTEARRLIELRDDVLDEVNQLYFDRQRALAAAAQAAPGAPDAAREELRAAELAAGLDAWTDGWFGRAVQCAAANVSPPR
jgi:hypothetical protein